MLLSELLDGFLDDLSQPSRRYPLVRSGEREPIPYLVRLSIYRRDGFTCRECGWCDPDNSLGMLELDHMLPWSAGGGDYSGNLRTLCSPCNQARSNWDDGADGFRVTPTTWWCWDCWRHPALDPEPDYCDPMPLPRAPRPTWRDGTNLAGVPYVCEQRVAAYCAWCQGYGYTDRLFDEHQQRGLAQTCMTTPRRQPDPTAPTEETENA